MDGLVKGAVLAVCGTASIFLGVATYKVWQLPDLKPLLAQTTATVKQTNDTVKDLKDTIDALYPDIQASVDTATVSSKETYDMVADLHAQLTGGPDVHGVKQVGILPQVADSVSSVHSLISSIQGDLSKLTDSTDATLVPLKATLENVATLTDTLNEQVKTNGPALQSTIKSLNADLATLNQQLSNPAISETLVNVDKATNHLANTAETVDIVTLPMRKKAKLVILILEKIMGIVKFSIAPPL
jgi:ABC-type transporter Mla subunit MlaD